MTRKFGLIGYPLTHSFSRKYFTGIFEQEGINAVYENFPLADISEVSALKASAQLDGLNVTIPYKEAVIPYLDHVSEAVQSIGACNCIVANGSIWTGYNTDVTGFEVSLKKKLLQEHKSALVLGTGGAAKAVWYVLRQLEIPFQKVSRTASAETITYEDLTADMVASYPLIINTTPLGMYPNVDECPKIPYEGIGKGHYLYDLVYNPARTLFLQKGAERGAVTANGEDMLVIQANESRKHWKL